jgi:hypothetical protein
LDTWFQQLRCRLSVFLVEEKNLGGRLKTGHMWTPENRPTEQNQNKIIYTLQSVIRANIFSVDHLGRVYTDFTWAEDMATQGCDQSADSAAGMTGGDGSRPASRAAILARKR